MELRVKGKNIQVEYLGREVLDIEEVEIYEYDRIGLVGANGAGKSTLLKVLIGEMNPEAGEVNRLGEFAYIPQLEEGVLEETKDFALMGKLGVDKIDTRRMSGGEETRMKIAQALSNQAHGIFADEPTSHLDREGMDFLIGQLTYFLGALLVISHDRYFLDEVVHKIWELEDGKITEYWGNYSNYLQQKEEERKNQTAKYEEYRAECGRLEEIAEEKRTQALKINQKTKGRAKKNRSKDGGRLSHQKPVGSKQKKLQKAAKSMEQKIQALEKVQAPEQEHSLRFKESEGLRLHNPFPIIATEINKSFGEKVLFEKASFTIPLGGRVAFVGGNGAGKTTLMEMIMNREEGFEISPKAKIGYFTQGSYKYDGNQNLINHMQADCDYNVSEIRGALSSMGFTAVDLRKNLRVLSGGEIIKLMLLKVLLGKYNILLLDEPSNYLDLPGLEALESLIKGFQGTLIFISHDRRLVENVADVIYEIKNKKIIRIK